MNLSQVVLFLQNLSLEAAGLSILEHCRQTCSGRLPPSNRPHCECCREGLKLSGVTWGDLAFSFFSLGVCCKVQETAVCGDASTGKHECSGRYDGWSHVPIPHGTPEWAGGHKHSSIFILSYMQDAKSLMTQLCEYASIYRYF